MKNKEEMPFPEEQQHLEVMNQKLQEALGDAEAYVEKLDQQYMESKRYMADYRGEIDPHEMFQNELLLKQTDRTGVFAVERREKIKKMIDSPYFARIDFREGDEEEALKYYIGRFAFSHGDELLIFDWRAPISSIFYDCEVGPASFEAPAGRIDGELTRKRQFKIKNGVMEYALESSSQVQDDVLQKELAHTSDEKMKSIIGTIQKEQNEIIRSEKAESMIIQGVAGSGKTSIALHRIAFLLYRYKKQLKARNVAILSPNKVFGDYIANVLPELGEEPIYQMGFDDLATIQLKGVAGFQEPFETGNEKWAQRVRYKSTADFVSLMDQYIAKLPETIFVPEDYTFGHFTAAKDWIQRRFLAYGQDPVKKRLVKVAEDIRNYFEDDNIRGYELPAARVILKSLTSMLAVKSPLPLYKQFYREIGKTDMLVIPQKKTLEWSDVYPFLYLYGAFEGLKKSEVTKHLVIDEMQDYTPIQYAVINRLFPCQKTILGDFGQSAEPNHCHTLEDLRQVYPEAKLVRLNKSYRSTLEIINFAGRIQKTASLEAIERHGEEPALIQCADAAQELEQIKNVIQAFAGAEDASLGIILKTNEAARALYDSLAKDHQAALLTPESNQFHGGVTIASVQMAKGLEFDEVLIPQADRETYFSDHDRSLLYIACTRAMHRLTLTCSGQWSDLLP